MKKGPLRILATLLLIVTLLNVSGLTATAGTLITAATANSCCDHGCDEPPAPGSCSTPDCPCFSCITMDLHATLTLRRTCTESSLPGLAPPPRHPAPYLGSIEYPPEQA